MVIRIAASNVANFFRRPNILTLVSDTETSAILADHKEFSEIIKKLSYVEPDKARLAELLGKYHLENRMDIEGAPFVLRETRGGLFKVTGADFSVTFLTEATGPGKIIVADQGPAIRF